MPRTEQEIKAILSHSMGEIAKELWTEAEAAAIVEKYAQDITEQQILALAAETEEKRREHRQNIQHLLESMRSKATERYNKIHGVGVHVFAAALKALISLLIRAVLVS